MPGDEWIGLLIQVPMVGALCWLVLALADRHHEWAKLSEESHLKVIDSLLGLVDDLASRSAPEKLTAQQLKAIEEYLDIRSKTSR